jgi:hypothetical protein
MLDNFKDYLDAAQHAYIRIEQLSRSKESAIGVERSSDGIEQGLKDARIVYKTVVDDSRLLRLADPEGRAFKIVLLGLHSGITLNTLERAVELFPLEPLDKKVASMAAVQKSSELNARMIEKIDRFPLDRSAVTNFLKYIVGCLRQGHVPNTETVNPLLAQIRTPELKQLGSDFHLAVSAAIQSRLDADKWMGEAILEYRLANPDKRIIANFGTDHGPRIFKYLESLR